MKLTDKLMYNAITLYYANKVGWEMEKDMNAVLKSKDNLSVSQLLNLSADKFMKTNANEVMGTTQVGFWKEFVEETILATELIERLKVWGSLLVEATIKLMEGKSIDIPVRGKRVRMSLTTEVVNAPTGGAANTDQIKKVGTASINLTAKEMKITIYYSDTWLEDSVIAVAEYVLQAITDAYDSSIHEILINGDTTTGLNANINIIDWNTTALPDWDKTDLILADWGRKVAFDNTATVDALTNLAIENIRSARGKMGAKGIDPSKLRMVPDLETYTELMNLSEVLTIEKFGTAATIKNGILEALDWIKIINREELLRALATGKQSATPASNVLGQILIVHTPSINVWIRRGLTTELSRYAEDGVTGITGSARIAVTLDNTQNNILATSPSALIINV